MPKWLKVLKSKKVKSGVEKKGAKVEAYWKSLAPNPAPIFGQTGHDEHRAAPAHGSPGDYVGAISGHAVDGDIPRWRVEDTDFKAKWIEYGNKHMPEYAPLAKVKAKFR